MPTDTKTALLDSAERAARTLGFDGFSYADLAEDVGIRKASIHHHFPSKAKLSVELMQRYFDKFETLHNEFQASSSSGGVQLSTVIDNYRAGLDGGKSLCLCVSFTASRESLPPEVSQLVRRFRTMIIGWLEDAFRMGHSDGTITHVQDPAQEAAAALSLFEGAQLSARAQEDIALFDNAVLLLKSRIIQN
ncbi:MAG: TetR/AcrR family transcriptional regulator [Paracoccaceae bacterium]